MQLEVGNTSTGYEPYSGQTYQINWADIAGTIYGGHLDVTTGLLTSTLNENGEELSEPVTYQLTPTEVRTFWGNNTIWADTGDVAVTYRADPTIEIDRKVDKTDYDKLVTVFGQGNLSTGTVVVPTKYLSEIESFLPMYPILSIP